MQELEPHPQRRPWAAPLLSRHRRFPPSCLLSPTQCVPIHDSLTQRETTPMDAKKSQARCPERSGDRKSVVSGKSVSVRVDRGGRRIIKKITDRMTIKNQKRVLANIIRDTIRMSTSIIMLIASLHIS